MLKLSASPFIAHFFVCTNNPKGTGKSCADHDSQLKQIIALFFLVVAPFAVFAEDTSAVVWSGPTFVAASGACQGRPGAPLWGSALSWDRHDLPWHECEPRKGEWNEAYLKRFGEMVLKHRKAGVTLLPVLGYNAPWSWDRSQRELTYGKKRRTFMPQGADKFEVLHEKLNGDGVWIEEKREIVTGGLQWPLAVEYVSAWESYVRRSVSFLMAPPYNLSTFQIWNEAHPASGFWEGDLDAYMTRVHLPAARIIRELGGKVVYGGWPCCGTLKELTTLLDKHDAWSSIDVLDVHYFGLNAFEYLRKAAAERGFPEMGVWQTEVCFNTQSSFISTFYPRFLDWSLRNGWDKQADRYKIFFFAYWSPDDVKAYGYRKTLLSGERLSPHGQSLQTLGKILGDSPLVLYDKIQSEPELFANLDGRCSSLQAFEVGKNIVISIQWVDEMTLSRYAVKLSLPGLKPEEIEGVERWEAAGWVKTLKWQGRSGVEGGGVQIEVPLLDRTDLRDKLRDSDRYKHGFYVVVRRKSA